MRPALAALVALAVLAPAARAEPSIDFAAGQQFMEPQAADFTWPTDSYWTDHRDTRAWTPAMWRLLKRHHARININLRYGRDFGPIPAGRPKIADAMPLIRGAQRHGVPFAAWLTVPYRPDGYFATETNAVLMKTVVRAYFNWARRKDVHADGVLMDLEASVDDTRTAAHLHDDPIAVEEMLRRNVGPVQQCSAAKTYREIAGLIHRHGLRAIAAAYPFYLDDILNGDLALSDGLNLPVFTPGTWDMVDFMTMRTVLKQMIGIDPGGSVLVDYGHTIQKWFPQEGQLNVAVPGTPPYDDLDTWLQDIGTAASVKLKHPVGIYSLEALYAAFGMKGVRRTLRAAAHPGPTPAISPASRALRAVVAAEDASVAAGTFPGTASTGQPPALPNPWPTSC